MENPIHQTQTSQIEAASPPATSSSTDNFIQPLSSPQPVANKNYWKSATGFLFFIVVLFGIALAYTMLKKQAVQNMGIYSAPTSQPLSSPNIPIQTNNLLVNPIADWKSYSDPSGKYSFQYPAEWNLVLDPSGNPLLGPNATVQHALVSVTTTNATSLENSLSRKAAFGSFTNKTDIIIDGNKGVRGYAVDQTGSGEEVLLFKEGKIYDISTNSQKPNDLKLFDELVSTFKIGNLSKNISDRDLYTNSQLGYYLKLPTDVVNLQNRYSDGSSMFVKKSEADPARSNFSVNLQILQRNGTTPQDAVKSETCGGCTVTTQNAQINNAIGLKTTSGFVDPNYYLTDQEQKGPVVRIFLSGDTNDPVYKELLQAIQTFSFSR